MLSINQLFFLVYHKAYKHFDNIADSVIEKYESFDKERVVFALGAPDGARKSVVSIILSDLIGARCHDLDFVNVSLDAYHFMNNILTD